MHIIYATVKGSLDTAKYLTEIDTKYIPRVGEAVAFFNKIYQVKQVLYDITMTKNPVRVMLEEKI